MAQSLLRLFSGPAAMAEASEAFMVASTWMNWMKCILYTYKVMAQKLDISVGLPFC